MKLFLGESECLNHIHGVQGLATPVSVLKNCFWQCLGDLQSLDHLHVKHMRRPPSYPASEKVFWRAGVSSGTLEKVSFCCLSWLWLLPRSVIRKARVHLPKWIPCRRQTTPWKIMRPRSCKPLHFNTIPFVSEKTRRSFWTKNGSLVYFGHCGFQTTAREK